MAISDGIFPIAKFPSEKYSLPIEFSDGLFFIENVDITEGIYRQRKFCQKTFLTDEFGPMDLSEITDGISDGTEFHRKFKLTHNKLNEP